MFGLARYTNKLFVVLSKRSLPVRTRGYVSATFTCLLFPFDNYAAAAVVGVVREYIISTRGIRSDGEKYSRKKRRYDIEFIEFNIYTHTIYETYDITRGGFVLTE